MFHGTTGYNLEAQTLVRQLSLLGANLEVVVRGRSDDTLHVLDQRTRSILELATVGRAGKGRVRSAPALELHHVPIHLIQPDPATPVKIGRTMIETDRVRAAWADRCRLLDQVWVPSRFNAAAFAAAGLGSERVKVFPIGVETGLFRPRDAGQSRPKELGPAKDFKFLSVFAWQRRKGWDILVRAFLEEFRPGENVTLVLKVTPFFSEPAGLAGGTVAGDGGRAAPDTAPSSSRDELRHYVRDALGRDLACAPRICVTEAALSRPRLASLYAACDAFVLPSRGEGFGRPYLEAMAAGLPTLGTNWGGNLDFMTTDNSYLIDIDGPEPADSGRAASGVHWARPSVGHLRELMRRVYAHPDEARTRGRQARQDVTGGWDAKTTCLHFARELLRFL